MMTNREIAKTFQLLAKMMELHGENEFRTRAYRNAYDALKRLDRPLSEMTQEEIVSIKGIGQSTGEKIAELLAKGSMERFAQYAKKTPEGIRELLMIKGLGAGKVKAIWKEMGIETPGELLYACNENRLVEFSGFGLKTQAEIRKQLEYHLDSEGKFLWAVLEPEVLKILAILQKITGSRVACVGEFARKTPVVEDLVFVAEGEVSPAQLAENSNIEVKNATPPFNCIADEIYRFTLHTIASKGYDDLVFELTGDAEFLAVAGDMKIARNMPPELMEGENSIKKAAAGGYKDLISVDDIHGILHCHSTYSDGLHTLKEMAQYTKDAGYAYLGITDHSKTAVYARGLSVERVHEQWKEIDALNADLGPFKVFKGIESDILADGALDYEDELLKQFDFVIASVHSVLKMDREKATRRLINAIENPYTRILGHPTGRLLLARQGYPIDHMKVIDACAANKVVIELNANPQRLDMDASHIPYALEKGVMIAVNPDAHSRESIHNVRYGTDAARRGGLGTSQCLNCLDLAGFEHWIRDGR